MMSSPKIFVHLNAKIWSLDQNKQREEDSQNNV